MSGLLPPISKARIFSGWARQLPVQRGARAGAAREEEAVDARVTGERDAGAPPLWTRLSTPAGSASSQSRAVSSATLGVSSEGLNTTQLPAIRAGTMWPFGR